MYTQGQIRVESKLSIESVDRLHWEMKRGEHGRLMLQGGIAWEEAQKGILGRLEDSVVKLYADEELLFCGLMEEVRLVHEGQSFKVELKALSSTIKLDEEKRSRSFQDTKMTYQEAFRKVLEDTAGAMLNFQVQDRELEIPAYQLEETDWEWIKRMSSHLQEAPLAWSYGEAAGVQIGLGESGRYREIGAEVIWEKAWKREGILYRQIRAEENWEIGDRLLWEDKEYFILEKRGSLEKGLLWFYYTAAKKEALEVKSYHNPAFIGRRLAATVLERKGELLRVKFDMDKSQDGDRAYWYPWCPVSGNLLYCMPEVGESVCIELENAKGSRARAVEGIRQNGKGNPQLSPAGRLFTTKDKKRMELSKEKLIFQDLLTTQPLQLLLEDITGIEVRSNRKLNIRAKGAIGMRGENLYVQAPKEISLIRKDSLLPTVINMCNGFDSVGQTNQVQVEKEGVEGLLSFETEAGSHKSRAYCLRGMEAEILASTPLMEGADELERRIAGSRVEGMRNE